MFNYQPNMERPDLGGLMNRAREHRQRFDAQQRAQNEEHFGKPGYSQVPMSFGPPMSPAWDAWFQSLADQGTDKLSYEPSGEGPGMLPQSAPSISTFDRSAPTYDPSFQKTSIGPSQPPFTSTYDPSFQKTAIGPRTQPGASMPPPPLAGLRAAAPGGPSAQITPYAGRKRPPVLDQRGTTGLNQSRFVR